MPNIKTIFENEATTCMLAKMCCGGQNLLCQRHLPAWKQHLAIPEKIVFWEGKIFYTRENGFLGCNIPDTRPNCFLKSKISYARGNCFLGGKIFDTGGIVFCEAGPWRKLVWAVTGGNSVWHSLGALQHQLFVGWKTTKYSICKKQISIQP